MVKKTYKEGTCFFRARISPDANGFVNKEMFAPPVGKRTAGRVNPDGIGVLYLSTDDKTVLNETRVTAYDYVTIGTFKNIKPLKIVIYLKFLELVLFCMMKILKNMHLIEKFSKIWHTKLQNQ